MYRTVAQLDQLTQQLAQTFPQQCTRIQLPEASVQGRPVFALRLRGAGSVGAGRRGVLLIGGGVGITPIRSLLEESVGSVVVLYRVQNMTDAVLLPELQALARDRGARLHVLTGRTGAGDPPNTPFEPANLAALVPDILHRDVFVCGPPAMTNAVLRSLRALNVPRLQVHSERFGFAGG